MLQSRSREPMTATMSRSVSSARIGRRWCPNGTSTRIGWRKSAGSQDELPGVAGGGGGGGGVGGGGVLVGGDDTGCPLGGLRGGLRGGHRGGASWVVSRRSAAMPRLVLDLT